jgi:hypothetical protein
LGLAKKKKIPELWVGKKIKRDCEAHLRSCPYVTLEVKNGLELAKEVKRLAVEGGDEGQPIKKQRTLNFAPHKKGGPASKVKVKIDKITEKYVLELKALKALASMSDDPEEYGEGKKILSFIKHMEEGRAKHGI